MRKIKIPTDKGNIATVVHYPKEKTNKLAILCPGYLDSKDYDHLKTLAEDLTKLGYTAVRFDPIGTWESDGKISDYTNTNYLGNIKNIIDYMLQKHQFNYILVGGHSRGGKIALVYGAKDSRVRIALGIMPPSEIKILSDRAKKAKETGFSISTRDLPNNKNQRREFKVPYSHFVDNLKYDVLKEVRKIRIPVILVTGDKDTIVSSESVRKIFDNANEPKKFILIKGVEHDYRHSLSEIRLVNDQILKALKSYEN